MTGHSNILIDRPRITSNAYEGFGFRLTVGRAHRRARSLPTPRQAGVAPARVVKICFQIRRSRPLQGGDHVPHIDYLSFHRCSALIALPPAGWASCTYADGIPAPKPGPLPEASKSAAWGEKFVELYMNLSKADKSTIDAVLKVGDETVLITRCSPHDLFWTHLSLLELSEVVDAKLPDPVAELTRAYKLTSKGRESAARLHCHGAMTQHGRQQFGECDIGCSQPANAIGLPHVGP